MPGEVPSADVEAIASYLENGSKVINEHDYSKQQI